jgi:DNA adenine methylase
MTLALVPDVRATPNTPKRVQPFLRWTGGKRQLVDEIRTWLPAQWKCFHEPFLGSGALFFAVRPVHAFLSDANNRLTCTFGAVQRELPKVVEALKVYAAMYEKHGASFYTYIRDVDPDTMEAHELAAWFIFCNNTNFQGMYRVNSSGKYNVPAGKFTTPPKVCDEESLLACSKALGGATIINSDFRAVEQRAMAGDFVYMDPPYVPLSTTADFTTYTAEGFKHGDQVALRDLARRLKKKGVYVILSNSAAPLVRELYADGFEIREVSRKGSISAKTEERGRVTELLIR